MGRKTKNYIKQLKKESVFMEDKTLGLKTVSELAKILDERNLTEIEFDTEDVRIRIARENSVFAQAVQAPAMSAAPVANNTPATLAEETADLSKHPGAVKSPMVGVVYTAPEPSSPNFVKEGDSISAGDTLLLVEAMKTFNPVKATKSGTITKILVEDGMPVEFGEPLMIIE
jgi:acetyl-CoA carboxylase biotin carboxyl carrier protein